MRKGDGFKKGFANYVCDGDSISCTVDGFDVTARVYRDDCSDKPDERQDGFWPSLDPKDAGFIGEGKTPAQLTAAKRKASHVMNAWKNGDWWYVGIAVSIERCGIELTGEFDNAVWGIECNYPSKRKDRNSYLMQVANELLPEAIREAEAKLRELLESV